MLKDDDSEFKAEESSDYEDSNTLKESSIFMPWLI